MKTMRQIDNFFNRQITQLLRKHGTTKLALINKTSASRFLRDFAESSRKNSKINTR